MRKYRICFWFEYGGVCLWSDNRAAEEKYSCGALMVEQFPISDELKNELNKLNYEYGSIINWEDGTVVWTREQKLDFANRANDAYEKLKIELGDDYEIINDSLRSVYLGECLC